MMKRVTFTVTLLADEDTDQQNEARELLGVLVLPISSPVELDDGTVITVTEEVA